MGFQVGVIKENASNDILYSNVVLFFFFLSFFHSYLFIQLTTIWECQWRKKVENSLEIREFLKQLDIPPCMKVRSAFYGGRTSAIKLWHKVKENQQIHYYDFTSLYPTVNKLDAYPRGWPEIILQNFDYTLPYFGLIHAKVVAPDQMIHAVLPFRTFSKDSQGYVLKFPLCGTCAVTESSVCNCSDEERSLTGCWTTEELKLALEKGYRLLKIHEVGLLFW